MFFNSFWQGLGIFQANKVKELLEKDSSIEIEELFDEDTFLNDVKSLTKFSDYLVNNPTKLKRLIDYCIQEQNIEDQCDQNKSLKYPFLASETFTSDLSSLLDFLFGIKQQEEGSEEKDEDNKSSDKKQKESADNDEQEDEEEEKEKEENSEKGEEEKEKEETEEVKSVTEEDTEKQAPEPEEAKWEGNQFLDYIFSFLEKDYQHDYFCTSAGYFAKIIGFLLKKEKLFWKYLAKNPQVLENILKHVDNKSISDIIYKMIFPDSGARSLYQDSESLHDSDNENSNSDSFLDKKKQIVDQLMVIFDQSDDADKIENIANIISCDNGPGSPITIYKVRSYQKIGEQLLEQKNLDILFNKLLTTNSTQITFYTASILNGLVQMFFHLNKSDNNKDEGQVNCDESNKYQIYLEIFAKKLPQLLEALEREPETPVLQHTQFGEQIKAFGTGRTKIIEVFANLLKCKSVEVQNALQEIQFYKVVFQYMVEYDWNNLLHIQIQKIFENTLETESYDLIKCMFEQVNMVQFLTNGYKENSEGTNPQNQVKLKGLSNNVNQGKVGFLNRFGNTIVQYLEKKKEKEVESGNDAIIDYFQNNEEWNNFVNKSLNITLDLENNRKLGGGGPNGKDDQSDDDYNNDSSSIQDIYKKLIDHFSNSNSKSMGDNQKEEHDDDDEDEELEGDVKNKIHSDSDDEELLQQDEQETTKLEKNQSEEDVYISMEQKQKQESKKEDKNENEKHWMAYEAEQLDDNFNTSNYWHVESYKTTNESDIDKLLNE
ncbi:hypothetical protein PPERSA_05103 [Pseudocohnilembus persalinus]|uniref:Armadillo-type fold n=1 Tax=Pseudocohnilembus persalinus TaxID=266149 RepID=A0A0V0QWQ9_PSEPJ|nr:hypothetical protein PPERSA_05103 [Pseudocohnilembus persalinus]|eukprot:KRX06490.1 hypothetical protein PPERSA_05103 [Pseudocohnilembus persalinus]